MINNDKVEDACFDGVGCTITTASTDIMCGLLIDKSKEEAFRIIDMTGFNKDCKLELYTDITNKACNYLYNRCQIENNKWNPNVKSNDDFSIDT